MITSFLLNIFFAFLGGLVMNFMPCILPLISLKISSFLQTSSDRKAFISKNIFYMSGILSFFLLFGILLSILRTLGNTFINIIVIILYNFTNKDYFPKFPNSQNLYFGNYQLFRKNISIMVHCFPSQIT